MNETERPARAPSPIAVVGAACLFPGSSELAGFWQDIVHGRDRLRRVPADRWIAEDYFDPDPSAPDKIYVDRGGFLDAIAFDPMRFGVPPSILPSTDSTQLLALVVAEQVLRDAFGDEEVLRDRTSVILGVTGAQKLLGEMNSRLQRPIWVKALRELGLPEDEIDEACARIAASYVPWQESTFPGVLGNVVAGRIANRLDLGGTNCVTDAACASALSALKMGLDELALGHSDVVVCGGADTMNDPFMFECFAKTKALSRSGDCRPFSDQADGTMLGEGIGMVVLTRLEDAERRGDRVYAVIRGLGSSSDGRAKSVYAPRPEGQAKALRRAYERAGYSPRTVELVEAHGTGTAAGDAAEVEALATVFAESSEDAGWCALGSVKSQIGHTKAAAGSAGLIKALLALSHGVVPPTIKIDRPHPSLDLERGPFHLSTTARPWIRNSDHPRRASVSSFGFGGSNFHVTLEEYGGERRALRVPMGGPELVVLSADDAKGLTDRVRALDPIDLRWTAWTTQRAFDAKAPARLAIVAKDVEDLRGKLEMAQAILAEKKDVARFSAPSGIELALGAPTDDDVAFLYPGQGSQYVGMGGPLAMRFERARRAWDRAADGLDVHRHVFPPPRFDDTARAEDEARLRATEVAQPALGVASLAVLEVLRALGVEAAMHGGHSFGEVSALAAAGVLSERDLFAVAQKRGQLMAEAAATPGAMLAISASIEAVRAWIEERGLEVTIANHNHPTQVVVSGTREAIEAADEAAREARWRAQRLDVATAFHSPIVSGSRAPFEAWLEEIPLGVANAPVYANATAAPYAEDVRATLAAQLASPVRFVEEIEAMYAAGARTFVEVGPGSVLTGLVARILEGRPHRAIALDRRGARDIAPFLAGIAALAAEGVALRFEALFERERLPEDPASRPAPRMSVPLTGANLGKPYPPEGGLAALPKPNPPRARRADEGHASAARAASVGSANGRAHGDAPAGSAGDGVDAGPRADTSTTRARSGRAAIDVEAVRAAAHAPASEEALLAFLATQQKTADAHAAYQQAVGEAHAAFLRTAESAMATLAALAGGVSVGAMPAPGDRAAAFGPPTAGVAEPAAVLRESAGAPASDARTGSSTRTSTSTIDGAGASTDAGASSLAIPAPDLTALMLAVVAEKTGYPADMLDPAMELEADLGVDSIKRVEILAALRERAPELPELDPARLGALRTLAEITAVLGESAGGAVASTGTSTSTSTRTSTIDGAGASTDAGASSLAITAPDLTALMLAVVAEKTGYPADMLDPAMELEADLGVDSIKRVEILAALRERAPELPELDPARLGALRTLAEITAVLGESAGGAVASTGTSTGTSTSTSTRTSTVDGAGASAGLGPPALAITASDLTALMLAVVAEKTGYPSDMLDPAMELEADLGVDSIKRVEILAALRERAPELPELDPARLGALRTLAEITAVLAEGAPSSSTIAAPKAMAKGSPTLTRAVVRAVHAEAPGLAPPGLFGTRVYVDGDLRAEALVEALRAAGVDAVAAAPPDGARAVIDLGGLGARTPREGLTLTCRLARSFVAHGGLFVSVLASGGTLGRRDPEAAARLGLVKTAALEWPEATVRAIDVATDGVDDARLIARIAQELIEGGVALEVGLDADGTRRVPTVVAAPIATAAPASPPVVVASGGARGVTAACVIALARETGGRFLLLGRSPSADEPAATRDVEDAALERALIETARRSGETPSPRAVRDAARAIRSGREIRATLAAIRAAGAEAEYAAVDVADAAALRVALDDRRTRWGGFTTLVHGAGVLRDRLLADKDPLDLDRVLATKLDGARALLSACASDPLESVTLFSSVAARYGNPGQSDYAMANAALDALAAEEATRRPDARVRALAWGPWEGGMVSPALAAQFAARGVPLIGLDEGAAAFVREVLAPRDDDPQVVLGPPMTAASRGERRFAIRIGRASHPQLLDHAVDGVPVLPVVVVLDLFARAATALHPELALIGCRDLRVLRGVRLDHFDEGEVFEVAMRLLSNGHGATYRAELSGARGLHYRAEVELSPERVDGAAPAPAPTDLCAREAPLYGGCLFHGERFRVIRRLEGVGEGGAVARLVGTASLDWPRAGWRLDPALLDGGLQLAVLWSERRLGGDALPTAIEALLVYVTGPIEGEVRAIAVGRSAERGRAVCDVSFVDASGRAVAELRGVETHVRPGTARRDDGVRVR